MKKDHFLNLYFKGIAMGAADVVPGVSGGTMAFILGIYPRLVAALTRFDRQAINLLLQRRFTAFWQHTDGAFLCSLFAGILTAVFSLAKGLHYLLTNYPILVWAFFFGLIVASIYFLGRKIPQWTGKTVLFFLTGALLAALIGLLPATNNPNPSLIYLFLCGMLAICAMILPGISGAFILVLLGAYPTVLEAVHQFHFTVLAALGAGAICGLLAFSHLLNYLFQSFYDITLATLTGFIAGSLVKTWPWKVGNFLVFPQRYDGDPHTIPACFLIIAGIVVVISVEFFGRKGK